MMASGNGTPRNYITQFEVTSYPVPVIAYGHCLQWHSNDSVMANYRVYGFSGTVAKPFDLTELNKAVRLVLSCPVSL